MKKIFILFIGLFCAVAAVKAQKWALSTNVLYGAAAQAPNLGVEMGLTPKTTLQLWGAINPFPIGENGYGSTNRKLKHWMISPEWRYFFCERFNGHYIGIHALGGQFNVGGRSLNYIFGDNSKDYRYEGYFYGGGVAYGYHWPISPRWNVDLEIGAGYVRMHYDRWFCKECGDRVDTRDRDFYFPTRATIGLVYLIK